MVDLSFGNKTRKVANNKMSFKTNKPLNTPSKREKNIIIGRLCFQSLIYGHSVTVMASAILFCLFLCEDKNCEGSVRLFRVSCSNEHVRPISCQRLACPPSACLHFLNHFLSASVIVSFSGTGNNVSGSI